MKVSTSLLYFLSLGVCAANPEWIAVLHGNHSAPSLFRRHVGLMMKDLEASHQDTFELGSFKGYAFSGSEDAAESIAQLPEVAYAEPNRIMSVYGTLKGKPAKGIKKQKKSSWNLREISHQTHMGDGKARYEYLYDEGAGQDTVVYVLDTGIDIKNKEFEGRAVWGMSSVRGTASRNATDDLGHGTHVAGIIGGRKYGVAKKTQLVAVKVADATGIVLPSDAVRGLLWSYSDAKQHNRLGRAIANLSFGSELWANATRDALMDAVAEVVKGGMFVVTSAGNRNADAARNSPGGTPEACNVGAHDEHGRAANFSSFGPGVDIWAPGVNIPSVAMGAVLAATGTSQAAPHVAGVAALKIVQHGGTRGLCDKLCHMGRLKGGLEKSRQNPDGGVLLYNGGEGLVPIRR